jgi:hypothetical protein
MEDFVERFKKKNGGSLDVANGKVTIEPLEARTVGDKVIWTSYTPPGGMTKHGFVRVTIRPGNGETHTAYFDLGSSTNMGNYGGDDHWFFDDTPDFRDQMDLGTAIPYRPPVRTPPPPIRPSGRLPSWR